MIERSPSEENQENEGPPEEISKPGQAASLLLVEQRLLHLEEAMDGLRDTRLLEERIAERVAEKLYKQNGKKTRASAGDSSGEKQNRDGNEHHSSQAKDTHPDIQIPSMSSRWFLVESFKEARTMFRMFFDRQYRLSLTGWLCPILVLAILTSWLWLPGTLVLDSMGLSWVARFLVKLVDLALAFLLYKLLIREARRYREIQAAPEAKA